MKVGDKALHKKARWVAYIEALYKDIKGGVRLDRKILGFWSWNEVDLVKVPPSKKFLRATSAS
jgi:hypothetical protein